jgi:hypothetical protein
LALYASRRSAYARPVPSSDQEDLIVKAVYRYWAWIVFLAVCLQVGFAGYGAFFVANAVDDNPVNEDKFEDGFGLHIGFGYLVVLLVLIFLVFAFAARVGKRRIIKNAVLFGLLILQVLLAWFGSAVPAIGFFHPLNAFVILGLSGSMAWTYWRTTAASAPAAATA